MDYQGVRFELLSVPGNVKVPAEGTTIEASIHAEGATITAAGDTMTYVELGMYEITKLITISKTVELMSVDAFSNFAIVPPLETVISLAFLTGVTFPFLSMVPK